MVQDFRILRVEAGQLERHVDRLRVAPQSGVGPLKLQARRALDRGIGRLREAFLQAGQRFVESAKLGQGHRQQDGQVWKGRFQLQRLTQRRDRLGELPLLKVTEAEAGVHFGHVGTELPERLVRPLGVRVPMLGERARAVLKEPGPGIGLLSRDDRARYPQEQEQRSHHRATTRLEQHQSLPNGAKGRSYRQGGFVTRSGMSTVHEPDAGISVMT